MSNNSNTRAAIKRAQKDLNELEKKKGKYSGKESKDINQQIALLKDTIKVYKDILRNG